MIFRHRRAIVWGALVLVLVAAVFALPVFGELGNENDFDDPRAEAVTARNAVTDATGAFAAPSIVALVRLGAPVESAQARERRSRASRRRCAIRGVASVASALPSRGGDRRLVSRDGRSTYLLATFQERRRAPATRIEERLARRAVRDARRRRVRRAAGRRPGLGRHRPRRADRVPDPLPADAARLPQRGLGAAAAGRRRLDDPAQLPGDPASSTSSTRCRSSR